MKTGRKDINSSASWLPQCLIILPPFPGSFGGSLCPWVSSRYSYLRFYQGCSWDWSVQQHHLFLLVSSTTLLLHWLCRWSGRQALLEPREQVGRGHVFGALREENCPVRYGEIQRNWQSGFISCGYWSLTDRNNSEDEYCRSKCPVQ